MIEYRTIWLTTVDAYKEAERLYASGWKIGRTGFQTIQLYKKTERRNEKRQTGYRH